VKPSGLLPGQSPDLYSDQFRDLPWAKLSGLPPGLTRDQFSDLFPDLLRMSRGVDLPGLIPDLPPDLSRGQSPRLEGIQAVSATPRPVICLQPQLHISKRRKSALRHGRHAKGRAFARP
jgi:hypothetical protein